MNVRIVAPVLQALLGIVFVAALACQTLVLPPLSRAVAGEFTDLAHMRVPILGLAILGLLCVEVAIVCLVRLLALVRSETVFSLAALRWVDVMIGAFAAGALVCVATLVYQHWTVAGPFLWTLALVCGVLGGLGLALLTWTMRTLLVQATALRTEMEAVI